MLKTVSPDAKAGDLVTVYDKDGHLFGAGLYNPKARVPLRVFAHGEAPFTEATSSDCSISRLICASNFWNYPNTAMRFGWSTPMATA